MKRRLFNFLAAASLLLFLCCTGGWVWSYWQPIIEWNNSAAGTQTVLEAAHGWFSVEHSAFRGRGTVSIFDFASPFWIPTLASLILPALWIHARRPRKIQADFCAKCRYDLRNLKSRRCPECGTYIPWLPLVNRRKVKFYR
ncbi:MAG TPA: hypothetical protein VFE47_25665 [Tepidisphaeraceae bacterium]|jgi:hypothetical protein|nr:hypothetical protein [Tepidisphaeraceae bacterium]